MIPATYLPLLSDLISEKLGLHFPENRWSDLSKGLLQAAEKIGFEGNGTAFSEWLLQKKFAGHHLDLLAEQLTIGETYFFRENQVLDTFRERIIPDLVREREHTTRSIRIWSAGCCSGEEPYTLAIILSQMIPRIDRWDITILATDINRRFLKKAAGGTYTPWSFRDTPPDVMKTYFTASGREFELIPKIRRMVTFRPFNLVDEDFPSMRTGTTSMDVIFCRNVLMYFDPENTRMVTGKFYASLNDQGWFITSQVELNDELFGRFEKVRFGNVFLYRKTDKPVRVGNAGAKRRPASTKGTSGIRTRKPPLSGSSRVSLNLHPPEKIEKEPLHVAKDVLALARSFADRGDLENALRHIKEAIQLDREEVEAYYLLGMIQLEQGDTAGAGHQLEMALYLDPNHLLAHFQVAMLCLRNGNSKQARKHKRNVTELLRNFQDTDTIPGTDGITAGHLKGLLEPI